MKLDIEPLKTFLIEDLRPSEFSKLLDEFTYDYVMLHFKVQLSNCDDKVPHEHATQFVLYIKRFSQLLLECEMK